jgi:membrane fusion protein, multidrug efflux system
VTDPFYRRQATLFAITFLACAHSTAAQQPTTSPVELSRLDVSLVSRQDVATEVRIAGSLSPIRRSTLTSRISSTVVELPVQIGDIVKKGDLLIRFDTEELSSAVTARKAEVEAIEAQMQLAQSVLERNITLGERGASSDAARLEAQANVLNLRAQLRSKQAELADAERSLSYSDLRAEFDGVVAARPVEEGQTVALNANLITIVDLSRMEVDAGVPTSRIPLVRLQQPVHLTVDGFPGRTFSGSVARISPTAVSGSRAVRVFITLENADRLLRGGMFTTGILEVDDRKGVIAVPSAAVRHDREGAFALRILGGVLIRQPITPGITWSDRDLVAVDGLSEGDVVVTAPLANLEAGTSVRVEGG